jgi:uncharacterized protein involved in exopolysaccharide biosynthesis
MDSAAEIDSAEHLTIAGLLVRIQRRPKTFLVVFVLSMLGVIAYAFLATPVYRGVVLLMPRENDNPGGSLQSVLGQFGGLAAMAGLSFGSVNEQEAIALLKSRALFTLFADRKDLMPILFEDKWDAAAHRWRTNLSRVPTMDDAWLMFDHGIRRVSDDPKTRLITLDVTWKDRRRAAEWANELVRLANDELRQRALRESAASIASYQQQLAGVDTVELRQSIYRLMEVQLDRRAVATSRLDYALTVIDPAFVSDPKHFVAPRRALLLVISGPLGLFLAACAVLIAEFGSKIRSRMQRLR